MEQNGGDGGLQFVLDNRRLILGFGLLIVLCGGFFVLGFVEGKRQGGQVPGVAGNPDAPPLSEAATPRIPGAGSASAPDDKTVRERLDWYNQVGAAPGGTNREKAPAPGAGGPEAAAADARGDSPSGARARPSAAPPGGSASYTVQVGAFRQRKEAEAKAAMLKARGYEYTIEPPSSPDQLFLLKVGRFASRAEAVALQLKLRRDGFPTFVKSN